MADSDDSPVMGSGAGSFLSGLAGGIGSIIGGAIASKRNLQATRETNEMNFRINQMNNEFNEQMMERQMEYNTEMWNKNNEYNTASAQRQRLEDAGLNPYLMMSGGSAGVSSSSPTASAASAASPIAMQSPQLDVSAISQMVSNVFRPLAELAQVNQMNAAANQTKIQNSFLPLKFASDIGLVNAQTKKTLEEQIGQSLMNDFNTQTMQSRVLQANMMPLLLKEQTSAMVLHNLESTLNLSFMPAQLQLGLAREVAGLRIDILTGNLTEKQVEHEQQEIYKTVAETGLINSRKKGQDILNFIQDQTKSYQIRKSYWDWQNGYALNLDLAESARGKKANRLAVQAGLPYADDMAAANVFGSYTKSLSDLIGTSLLGIGALRFTKGRSVVGGFR